MRLFSGATTSDAVLVAQAPDDALIARARALRRSCLRAARARSSRPRAPSRGRRAAPSASRRSCRNRSGAFALAHQETEAVRMALHPPADEVELVDHADGVRRLRMICAVALHRAEPALERVRSFSGAMSQQLARARPADTGTPCSFSTSRMYSRLGSGSLVTLRARARRCGSRPRTSAARPLVGDLPRGAIGQFSWLFSFGDCC